MRKFTTPPLTDVESVVSIKPTDNGVTADFEYTEDALNEMVRRINKRLFGSEHECDEMPVGVRLRKLYGSSSQFTISQYQNRVALQQTVLYGFKYCPYCGEKMESGDD